MQLTTQQIINYTLGGLAGLNFVILFLDQYRVMPITPAFAAFTQAMTGMYFGDLFMNTREGALVGTGLAIFFCLTAAITLTKL